MCGRKISLRCPDLQCKSGIWKKCVEKISFPENHFIFPPYEIVESDNTSHILNEYNNSSDEEEKSIGSDHIDNSSVISMLDLGNEINQQSDDINDFVIFGGDDDIPQDEVVPEY